MVLPASQYSVLDAQRIERLDEDTFRCYVGGLKLFSLEVRVRRRCCSSFRRQTWSANACLLECMWQRCISRRALAAALHTPPTHPPTDVPPLLPPGRAGDYGVGDGAGAGAHRAPALNQGATTTTPPALPWCEVERLQRRRMCCYRAHPSTSSAAAAGLAAALITLPLLPDPSPLQLKGSPAVEKANDRFDATMSNVVRWQDAPGGGKQIVSDTFLQVCTASIGGRGTGGGGGGEGEAEQGVGAQSSESGRGQTAQGLKPLWCRRLLLTARLALPGPHTHPALRAGAAAGAGLVCAADVHDRAHGCGRGRRGPGLWHGRAAGEGALDLRGGTSAAG